MNESKVDPQLRSQLRISSAGEGIAVIIRHKGDMFFSRTMSRSESQRFNLINATATKVSLQDIDDLSEQDSIEYIWADLPVHTCLDVSVPRISVPPLWADGLLGSGIKLAIVDTGIDPDHADFKGRIAAQKSFVSGDRDDNGHGTHVASIAAGSGAASNGKYKGVAPEAELYIAKVLDRFGGGSMSGVMAGIEWAVDKGVQVINLSLGSSGPTDGKDALSTLCNAAVAEGIVFCVAAGNDGPRASTVGSPGGATEVITIGATNDTDQITDFSSRGPTSDGRVKPDIVLPGFGIVAAQAAGTQLGTVVAPGYISLNGTSMATPHAAGAACLLLQAKNDLSPAQVKNILQDTAIDLGQPANNQGVGRGDILAAYQQISGTPPTPEPPTPEPPTPEPPTPEPPTPEPPTPEPPTPEPPTPEPPTPEPPTPPPGNKGCLPESMAKLLGGILQ